MNTEQKLTEILVRAEGATPPPWRHVPGDSYCAYPHIICRGKTLVFEDHGEDNCTGKHCEGGFPPDEHDAEFVAKSRTDLPVLAMALQEALKALRWYADSEGWDKDVEGYDIFVRGNVVGIARNDDFGGAAEEALKKIEGLLCPKKS